MLTALPNLKINLIVNNSDKIKSKLNLNSDSHCVSLFFRRQLIIYLNGNGVAVVVKICAA
jgi:hypothetical protein